MTTTRLRAVTSVVYPVLVALSFAAAAPASDIAPGTYTNEEQVYFDGEAGREPPPWTGVRLASSAPDRLEWHEIDRFGETMASATVEPTATGWRIGDCALRIDINDGGALRFAAESAGCGSRAVPVALDAGGMTLRLPDGRETQLRRARPFTCWLTVRRDAPKADGSEDWLFQPGLATHDQGGRLKLGGAETGAPQAIIRLRNVVWPEPTRNRPSLVLYVFIPEDTSRAVAYSWADPGATRVGINLRWMQASCTLAGRE